MTAHLRVLMWPTDSGVNPYVQQLVQELSAQGVSVARPTALESMRRHAAFHVHWPDWTLRGRSMPVAFARVALFMAVATWQRVMGARLIWTVHNLQPHGESSRVARALLYRFLRWAVHEQIHLSAATASDMDAVAHPCRKKPHRVIPIGIFERASTRAVIAELDGESSPPLVCAVGVISQYKGLEQLARTFLSTPLDARLVIAGLKDDSQLGQRLEHLAAQDSRTQVVLRALDEAELDWLYDRSTFAVFQFQRILNSASVLRALDAGVPAFVPNTRTFQHLLAEVGPRWLKLYDGALDGALLSDALGWARSLEPSPPPRPKHREWQAVAAAHRFVYSADVNPHD